MVLMMEGWCMWSVGGHLLNHVGFLAIGELEACKVTKQGHEPHEFVELQLGICADHLVHTDRMVWQIWICLRCVCV